MTRSHAFQVSYFSLYSLSRRSTSVTLHLLVFFSFQFKIRAGTRDPEKCKHLNELAGVTVVKAVMGDEFGLIKAFEGADYLFLVTPSVMAFYVQITF